MSEVVSASFAYPWTGSKKVLEPPGLTVNVGAGWSRLRLVGDLGVDVAPDTDVETTLGWLLPSEMVGREVSVKVRVNDTRFTINGVVVSQENVLFYKVLAVYEVPEGEVQVNQVKTSESYSGLITRTYINDDSYTTPVYDEVPSQVAPISGPNWQPQTAPVAVPGPGNPLVFGQQFTPQEVQDLRTLLTVGGGGGSGGDGVIVVSYVNVGTTDWVRGMPVYSADTGQGMPGVGSITGRGIVGLYSGISPLPPGGAGLVLVEGDMTQGAAAWELITGEAGGLVAGQKYFLDFTLPGRLTRDPNVETAPPGSYLVSVGYALNATTLQFELQSGIRVS